MGNAIYGSSMLVQAQAWHQSNFLVGSAKETLVGSAKETIWGFFE
jgi:hypothetical protein